MLETLVGKRVKVLIAFAKLSGIRHASSTEEMTGILTAFDDSFIILDNSFYISRTYLITIKTV